jgi:hypothetical protein
MQYQYVNYTGCWIGAIERGTTAHVEQLIQLLRQLPQGLAPTQPPPQFMFDPADLRNYQTEVQVRYLIFHCECRIVELIRLSAIHEERSNNWTNSAQFWSQAYDHLHRAQIAADPLYIIYVGYEDNSQLPDNHSYPQLHQLFEKIGLVKDHTQQERDRALETMQRRLEAIDRRLNPMRQDRDEVRGSMGNERWINNPRPKNDYSQKRFPLEEERRALVQAMEILQGLSLVPGAELETQSPPSLQQPPPLQ